MSENDPILAAALDALADIQLVDNTWQQADVAKAEILEHVRDMAAAYGASIEAIKAENERLTTERNSLRGRLEAEQYDYIGLKNSHENDTDSLSNEIELIRADFLKSQRAVGDLTSHLERLKAALEEYADDHRWYYEPDSDRWLWNDKTIGPALALKALEAK